MQAYLNESYNLNETNAVIDNLMVNNKKQHLINNDYYALLREYQQAIAKATDVSSFTRKLISELIKAEHLKLIKSKLIA